jgi:pSer/pThr/pTyr-binding forkhead associated (FHA) protein
MAQLSIETAGGRRVFDGNDPVRIGRDPSCEVIVDNPNVSRFHAELRLDDGGWVLTDTNSTQGVYVDGARVTRSELDGPTVVVLGRTDDAERITVDAPRRATSDAATRLPPAQTIVVDEDAQRPGGALRDSDIAAGTVVTGHTINVQCAGSTHTFEPGKSIVIGRDETCDVVADNPTVSRRHAELRHDGTHWHFVDLGSSRGIYVDGRRVTELVVQGAVAAWLGDPDAGERIVLVAEGERPVTAASILRSSARSGRVLAAVGAVVVIAVIVAIVALTRGGSASAADLQRATVRIDAPGYFGSGVIIDAKEGLILTNAHVADSKAPGLAVQYPQEFGEFGNSPDEFVISVVPAKNKAAEPRYRATVAAVDGYLDLAVLRITKTASGAFIKADDLKGLHAMKIGSSADMNTGDKIRLIGYPDVDKSKGATISDGVIASDVQDDRLNTNRAWFNETADGSPGSSGGALVDSDGRLVGVFAQNVLAGSATSNRARPVDLARELIADAHRHANYSSKYVTELPKDAHIVNGAVIAAAGDVGFSKGCDSSADKPASDAKGVGVQVQYSGFTPGAHQDMLVMITDKTSDDIIGLLDTASQFPFKFEDAGCVTALVPLKAALSDQERYEAQIFFGPTYGRVATLDFRTGFTNISPSPSPSPAPPAS